MIGVMVDEPQGGDLRRRVAAPAFGKIASFALPYLRSRRNRLRGDASSASSSGTPRASAAAVEITALAYDNRVVAPGTLFFCVPGFTRDGHDFAPDAVARGASALVVERPLGLGIPEVRVADVRAAMAPAAARLRATRRRT